MKKVIIFILMLLSDLTLAGSWSSGHTIEGVTTYGKTDMILVSLSDGVEYTAGCKVNSWVIDSDTEERRNRIYSTLMTALVAGKKVKFWYGDVCGVWNYHIGTVVNLTK